MTSVRVRGDVTLPSTEGLIYLVCLTIVIKKAIYNSPVSSNNNNLKLATKNLTQSSKKNRFFPDAINTQAQNRRVPKKNSTMATF